MLSSLCVSINDCIDESLKSIKMPMYCVPPFIVHSTPTFGRFSTKFLVATCGVQQQYIATLLLYRRGEGCSRSSSEPTPGSLFSESRVSTTQNYTLPLNPIPVFLSPDTHSHTAHVPLDYTVRIIYRSFTKFVLYPNSYKPCKLDEDNFNGHFHRRQTTSGAFRKHFRLHRAEYILAPLG